MLIIGHRGAAGHAPEHTLASYDLALEMGADYIEQDLQLTKDGVIVVMHDSTLSRTTNCSGHVRERTLAEIKQCDAGRWFDPSFANARVPTLRELFERYGTRVNYYIEIKAPEDAPGIEDKLLALLDEFGLRTPAIEKRQVLIESFSRASMLKIHDMDSSLPLCQLFERAWDSTAIEAELADVRRYAVGIAPHRTSITRNLVEAAHQHGLVVHPYTVNNPEEMKRLIEAGVDGMFTDHPDRLKKLV